MKQYVGNQIKNFHGKSLRLYTFNANINPIYSGEENEIITVKIPAIDDKNAWSMLGSLLGSMRKADLFRIDDVEPYE